MTIRVHIRRVDGFGESRNYFNVNAIRDAGAAWHFDLTPSHDPETGNFFPRTLSIIKITLVGLPEIVE
jgi:hypothetical protein